MLAFFLVCLPALLDRLSILTRAYGGTNHLRRNRYSYLKPAGNVYFGSFDCVQSTIKGSFQIECIDNNCRVETVLLQLSAAAFSQAVQNVPPPVQQLLRAAFLVSYTIFSPFFRFILSKILTFVRKFLYLKQTTG